MDAVGETRECYKLPGGGYYLGEVRHSPDGQLIRDGKGVQVAAGVVYEGDWKDNLMHGEGKLETNGEVYEGEFYDGLANGR